MVSDVKRYAFRLDPMADCNCSAEEDRNGGFVEIEHYDALRVRLAEAEAVLAYAASTGDECAIEVEALRSRLSEVAALAASRWDEQASLRKRLAEAEALLLEARSVVIQDRPHAKIVHKVEVFMRDRREQT